MRKSDDKKSWLKRAQSTAEYATLFAIIVGAIVAMQLFVKRAGQAKMKDAMMFFHGANGLNIQGPHQYEPYYLTQNITQVSNSQSSTSMQSEFAMATNSEAHMSYVAGSNEVKEGADRINANTF